MSYLEKKEWAEIDDVIANTEAELKDVTAEMAAAGSDFSKLQDLMKRETELNEKLEHLIERWTYLAELVE